MEPLFHMRLQKGIIIIIFKKLTLSPRIFIKIFLCDLTGAFFHPTQYFIAHFNAIMRDILVIVKIIDEPVLQEKRKNVNIFMLQQKLCDILLRLQILVKHPASVIVIKIIDAVG